MVDPLDAFTQPIHPSSLSPSFLPAFCSPAFPFRPWNSGYSVRRVCRRLQLRGQWRLRTAFPDPSLVRFEVYRRTLNLCTPVGTRMRRVLKQKNPVAPGLRFAVGRRQAGDGILFKRDWRTPACGLNTLTRGARKAAKASNGQVSWLKRKRKKEEGKS